MEASFAFLRAVAVPFGLKRRTGIAVAVVAVVAISAVAVVAISAVTVSATATATIVSGETGISVVDELIFY
jgi:hypothetical protein